MTKQEKIQALSNVDDDELCQMWAAHASTKDNVLGLYIDKNSKPLILSDHAAERLSDDVVFIAGLYDWEGAENLDSDRGYEERYEYAQKWMFNNVDMQADCVERFSPQYTKTTFEYYRGEYDWERQRSLGLVE